MKPVFEAVKTPNGFEVKTRLRKGGRWFTIADTYALNSKALEAIGGGDAAANAGLIARLLNDALTPDKPIEQEFNHRLE